MIYNITLIMKLSDYVIRYLAAQRVKHVFLITGGAIAHVVDSFRNVKGISYVCTQHEQAAAMAAEAYARLTGNIGVAMATSGPGATNLITGVCCAWFDSIPTVYVTGQVNREEQKGGSRVRQVGFQETDIVSIIKPITKFAAMVDDPLKIKYYLDKALYLAKSGRPGPVWLDIPMDVQRAEIDPQKLEVFSPSAYEVEESSAEPALEAKIKAALELMKKAKRPVIIAGGGIKLAKAQKEFEEFLKLTAFPLVTSWSGFDLVPHNYPLLIGQYGVYGNRGANFTVQNADLIIGIGSRFDTRQIGGRPETFAREARKIMVDIDQAELDKRRGVTPDLAIRADAQVFLAAVNSALKNLKKPNIGDWLRRAKEWKVKYPACLPEYFKEKKKVNPYVFAKVLSEELPSNAIVIPDDGGNLTWIMQAFELKKGQQLFSAFGNSPMGYSFPAGIGAVFAVGPKRQVVSIIGDGSFQINIQELQTIAHYRVPLKVFILNNRSYGIIKQFQDMYFGGRHEASSPEKGYSAPDFMKIAKAYGIKAISIFNHKDLRSKIRRVLAEKRAVICDVNIPDNQKLVPKLEFGKPIEELSPSLPRSEFLKNMIIKPSQS